MIFYKSDFTVTLFVCILITACDKGKSQTPPAEQPIAFTHNAGNNVFNPGAFLNFTVTLTSAMPASGILVEVSTKEEVSGNAVGTNSSINSSSAAVNVAVSSLPRQVWC